MGDQMPDILTHILQGEEVQKELQQQAEKGNILALEPLSAIENRPDLFLLGTQGPDIFFYHGFWPWQWKKSLKKLGSILHLEKTGAFFVEGFRYLRNMQVPSYDKDYTDILAYLCGCVCHYSLDRNAHPYIYRLAGFEFSEGRELGRCYAKHQQLEVIIDCILMERKKDKQAFSEPIYRLLTVQGAFPAALSSFYKQMIKNLYDMELQEKDIEKAYRDMRWGFRLIYDPHNIKKVLVKAINRMSKNFKLPRPLHPATLDRETDFLNEKQQPWCHPLAQEEVSRSSFWDIMEQSSLEAVELILQGSLYLDRGSEDLKTVFRNLSYQSNKEWGSRISLKKAQDKGMLDGFL